MTVVEVVARLGETLLDVAHVPFDGRYRIGSAAGVELPVEVRGLTCFPLVGEGHVVRIPAGIPATVSADGHVRPVVEPALRLTPGAVVELRLGLVAVAIRLAAMPARSLPGPPVERRPFVYGALALVAHLGVWMYAMTHASLDRLHAPLAAMARPVHVHLPDEPVPTKVPPPPPPAIATHEPRLASAEPQSRHDRAVAAARSAGMLGALGDLHGIISSVDLHAAFEGIGPTYREDDANRGNFGNSRGFDPTGRPDWGTVAPGDYGTVSSGFGAGDDYFPGQVTKRPSDPAIALCRSQECTVTGPIERAAIDAHLRPRFTAFAACYRRYVTPAVAGEVVIGFEIGADGKVRHTQGQGLGHAAGCVAEAAAAMKFPATDGVTQVTFALSFSPP